MRRKFLSVLLVAAMTTTLFGCGKEADDKKSNSSSNSGSSATTDDAEGGDDENAVPENEITGDATADNAFVVWGWNDDIKKILDGPFKEAYPDEYARIVFVNTGGSDYYQGKIDEILNDESNEIYPDIMGLEVDYVKKYTGSDYLLPVSDLGITSDDMSNMYQYNLDLGSDADGNAKALFWQATPACFAVRADLAEKYLGTTDPDELQKTYFSSWDAILDAAKTVKDAADEEGAKVRLLGGWDEVKRPLMNSRTEGFYDKDSNITIDANVNQYLELAQKMAADDLTYGTKQWQDDWNAVMDGNGTDSNAAVAFGACPWFVYWCLKDAWKANTILVPGPVNYFWGGTGLAATVGCADKDLAGTIIKALSCDADMMVAINALNSDYVNNSAAVDAILESGASADGNGYLYADSKQNFIEFFKGLSADINASTVTAEDQDILAALDTQTEQVAQGNKDIETAIADFKAAVHDTYSYLNVVD